jgi:hypothetical protein
MDIRIYGRAVTKDEYKLLRDTSVLYPGPGEDGQLIPTFDATVVLDVLDDLSRDEIKLLHRLMGGSAAADRICLFKTSEEPVIRDKPFQRAEDIRRLLGKSIKEARFKPGTKIEIVGWI